jgi:hypothetical protein
MRVPQLRFRVREMMVAVAVVGLLLALVSYRQRLLMLAARHESEAFRLFKPFSVIGTGPPGTIHRRTPGQSGISAYQPTPQGLEQMKRADEFSLAAANIGSVIAFLLLASVIIGLGCLLAAKRRQRRQGNAPVDQGMNQVSVRDAN